MLGMVLSGDAIVNKTNKSLPFWRLKWRKTDSEPNNENILYDVIKCLELWGETGVPGSGKRWLGLGLLRRWP